MARRKSTMDLSSILNPKQSNENVSGPAGNDRPLLSHTQARNEQIPTFSPINQPIQNSAQRHGGMSQMPVNNLTANWHNAKATFTIPPNANTRNISLSPMFETSTKRRIEEWLDETAMDTSEAKRPRLEERKESLGEQIAQPPLLALPPQPTLITPENAKVDGSKDIPAGPEGRKLSVLQP